MGELKKVIDKAIIACKSTNYNILEHFVGADKLLKIGNNANMKVSDFKLSRYACYLIAQNAGMLIRERKLLMYKKGRNEKMSENNLEIIDNNVFENIKHIDNDGNEYWLARELMVALGYIKWQKFKEVINKAIDTCKNSDYETFNHFTGFGKMINIAKGAKREILDYKLSRYACYLIAQNAGMLIRERKL